MPDARHRTLQCVPRRCWQSSTYTIAAGGGAQLYSLVCKPPAKPVGKRITSLANTIWPEVDALRPTKTRRLL